MGKNNLEGQLKTKKLTHFRMYKSGKQWMFAGAAVLGVAAGSQLVNQNVAHADTTDSNAGNNYSSSYVSSNSNSAASVDSVTVAQSVSAPSVVDSSANAAVNSSVVNSSSETVTSSVVTSEESSSESSTTESVSSTSDATISSASVSVDTNQNVSGSTNSVTSSASNSSSAVTNAVAVDANDDEGISNRDGSQVDYNSLAASQFSDDQWLNSAINDSSFMSYYNSIASNSSVQHITTINYSPAMDPEVGVKLQPVVEQFERLLNNGYLDQAAQVLRDYGFADILNTITTLPGTTISQSLDSSAMSSAFTAYSLYQSQAVVYTSFAVDSSASSLGWTSSEQVSFGTSFATIMNNFASATAQQGLADADTHSYTPTQILGGWLIREFPNRSATNDILNSQASLASSAHIFSEAVSNMNSWSNNSNLAGQFSTESSFYNSVGSGNWNASNFDSLSTPYYVTFPLAQGYGDLPGWDNNSSTRQSISWLLRDYFTNYHASIAALDSAISNVDSQTATAFGSIANHETNVYVKVVASSVATALNQSIADYQSQVNQLSSAVGPLNDSMSALNSHYQMAGSLAQSFSTGSNSSVANSLYNIAKNDYSAMSSLATVLSNTNLSLAVGQTNLQQYNSYVSSMLSSANNNGLNDPTSTDVGTIANIHDTASSQSISLKSQATVLTSNATQLSSAQSNTSSAVVQLQSLSNAISIASSQAASSAASVAASTADSRANSSAVSYAASVASSLAASYSAAQASLAAQSQANSIAQAKQASSVAQSLQQSIAASQAVSQSNSITNSQSASIANSIAVSIAVSSAKSMAASQQASQSASIAKSIADSIAAFNVSNAAQSSANAQSAATSASIAASLAASTATSIANAKAASNAASVSQSIANANSASDAATKSASIAASNAASQSASVAASLAASTAQSIANAKSASDAAAQSASIAQSIAASLAASVAASSANANTNQNNSGFSVVSSGVSSSSNTSLNSSSTTNSSSASASSSNTNPPTIDVNFKQKYYGLDNSQLVQQSRVNTITNLKKIDANNSALYVGQTVKFRLNGQVHNNFVFSRQNAVKNVKAGTKFKIKAVYVYNGIARFLVGKNQWITANVSYVKM